MLVFFFIFAIILSLANAQDYVESDDDNEVNGYGNNNSCISQYRDLESYVLNNENLMGDLSELFFKAGESFTEFVRITYKYQILLPVDNYTNNTNDTRYYDNDKLICINDQKKFIWSSSALYLLGPEPLFWQTLFAVYVRESSITINLPCLCSDVYDYLLSRLTYLVSRIYLINCKCLPELSPFHTTDQSISSNAI